MRKHVYIAPETICTETKLLGFPEDCFFGSRCGQSFLRWQQRWTFIVGRWKAKFKCN